jgi:hypothetical protein
MVITKSIHNDGPMMVPDAQYPEHCLASVAIGANVFISQELCYT